MSRRDRRSVWFVGLLLLVFTSAPLVAGWQAGAPRPSGLTPGQTRGSIILGRVVDGDTGDPVGGATVGLRGTGRPIEYVLSNGDGRFMFRDVAPGDYTMTSLLTGYVPAQYGQRRPRGPSKQLAVAASDRVTDVTIRQWRFASISGIVVDEAGEPVVGVQVSGAWVTTVAGRRVLRTVASDAMTDDRGVYRLGTLSPGEHYVFVPSTIESAPTSTANWYAEARAPAGAERDLLQVLRESSAPPPSPTGLRVGEHIVSSAGLRTSIGPRVAIDGRLEVYRTIYHPSAPTIDRATAVTVTSGEQRDDVNLQLVLDPAIRISGTVIGPGGPAAHLGVRLLPVDAASFVSDSRVVAAATITGNDGRFTLLGVPPGQYTIEVLRVPQATSTANRVSAVVNTGGGSRAVISASGTRQVVEAPESPTLWAEQTVVVGDVDVGDITLQLREGARVAGRLEFDDAGPAPTPETMSRFAVQLTPTSGERNPAFLRPPGADADGTFRTPGFPSGRYFVEVLAAPGPGGRWFLESAVLEGRDLTAQPLELEGDDVTGVVITMTDRLGELSGTVTQAPGEDDAATVAAFPADYRSWIANDMPASRSATTSTDGDGRFRIGNLRPGSYLAVAVPIDIELDLQDPALIDQLARQGTRVEIPPRGSSSVQLQITPVRRERP